MLKKEKVAAIILCFILGLFSLAFCQSNEEITITTYYPSPYGVYNDLVVTNELGVGTANPSRTLQIQHLNDAASGNADWIAEISRSWTGTAASARGTGMLFSDYLAGALNSIQAGIVAERINSGSNYTSDLAFYTNNNSNNPDPSTALGTEKMRLTGTGQILVAAGTASAPSYTFSGDTNTGMYRLNADEIDFTTGGTRRMYIYSSAIVPAYPIRNSSSGTAAAPVYSWYSDSDTGTFEISPNIMAFSTSGIERARINATGYVGITNQSPGTTLDAAGTIRTTAQVNPTSGAGLEISYTTGLGGYIDSVDRTLITYKPIMINSGDPAAATGYITIGTAAQAFTPTKLTVKGITEKDAGTGIYPLVYNTADGGVYYDDPMVSSARYKDNIQPLKDDFAKILKATPRSFTYKSTGKRGIGYIAEEFDELGLKDLVVYKDGQPDSLHYELISLYLAEVIKDQQKQIDELKAELKLIKDHQAAPK